MTPYDLARFWSKVKVTTRNQCWLWTAGTFRKNYGAFQYKGKTVKAHRVAWALFNGGVMPDSDVLVLHSCDNAACCNPKPAVIRNWTPPAPTAIAPRPGASSN